jgi:hypothetical protein
LQECEESKEHLPSPVDILGSAAIGSPEHLKAMREKEKEQKAKYDRLK